MELQELHGRFTGMDAIMPIAAKGLIAATERFEASAKRVASDPNADLAAEFVTQKMAETDFAANLKVIETAQQSAKHVLDILA